MSPDRSDSSLAQALDATRTSSSPSSDRRTGSARDAMRPPTTSVHWRAVSGGRTLAKRAPSVRAMTSSRGAGARRIGR